MYALMFRGEDSNGRRLFVFAVPDATEITVLAGEDEEQVASVVLSKYESASQQGGDAAASMVKHALRFAPVTVAFGDEPSFLDEVVGGGQAFLYTVRSEGGQMLGVECTGPRAEEAYRSGRAVPWLRYTQGLQPGELSN